MIIGNFDKKQFIKLPESAKWRVQRALGALRALRAHAPNYILPTGKLKSGNCVPIGP